MISALGIRGIAYVFILPFIMVFGLLLIVKCPTTLELVTVAFWGKHILQSFSVTVPVLLLLGTPKCIEKIWTRFPVLNRWIAPNINGVYEFQTNSNYLLKKAMRDCFLGEANHAEVIIPDQLQVSGKITIRMNLLKITMTYEPSTNEQSRSTSHVIGASLRKIEYKDGFELTYVYQSDVPNPTPGTDSQHYYGAARLHIPSDCSKPNSFKGSYWTNREWQNGLNTAGRCEASRI